MTASMLAFALWSCGQSPGPLDAYEANRAAVRAEIAFEFTAGATGFKDVKTQSIWQPGSLAITEHKPRRAQGRWASDGVRTVYRFQGSPEYAKAISEAKNGELVQALPDFELIFDGTAAAWHSNHDGKLNVAITDQPPFLGQAKSPFFHWSGLELPRLIQEKWQDASQVKFRSVLDGRPVEVESYSRTREHNWARFQVAYDPAIGLLPRHCLQLSGEDGKTRVGINQRYLVSADVTKDGAYVPTEWYEFSYGGTDSDRDQFDRLNGTQCVGGALLDGRAPVHVMHFVATSVSALAGDEVMLQDLGQIKQLAGASGSVKLIAPNGVLGLNQAVAKIGAKVAPKSRLAQSVDTEEIRQLNRITLQKSSVWSSVGVAIASAMGIAVAAWAIRKRTLKLLPVLVAIASLGCDGGQHGPGGSDRARVKLKGRFTSDARIVSSAVKFLPLALEIENAGAATVRVIGVSGGCTCRKVDEKPLPINLSPGSRVLLQTEVQPRLGFEPGGYPFRLVTDSGEFGVMASFVAIPMHLLDPPAVTNSSLIDREDWKFRCVHRQVYQRGGMPVKA